MGKQFFQQKYYQEKKSGGEVPYRFQSYSCNNILRLQKRGEALRRKKATYSWRYYLKYKNWGRGSFPQGYEFRDIGSKVQFGQRRHGIDKFGRQVGGGTGV